MPDQEKARRFRGEAEKARVLANELKEDRPVALQLLEIAQRYDRLAAALENEPAKIDPTPKQATSTQEMAAMKPQDNTEPKS
jgi:hypothetical protein